MDRLAVQIDLTRACQSSSVRSIAASHRFPGFVLPACFAAHFAEAALAGCTVTVFAICTYCRASIVSAQFYQSLGFN